MSCHQDVGQNHNLLNANKSFENAANSKHMEMTGTNENCIYEEINIRLNSGNVC
jgi:hypothetical protein